MIMKKGGKHRNIIEKKISGNFCKIILKCRTIEKLGPNMKREISEKTELVERLKCENKKEKTTKK